MFRISIEHIVNPIRSNTIRVRFESEIKLVNHEDRVLNSNKVVTNLIEDINYRQAFQFFVIFVMVVSIFANSLIGFQVAYQLPTPTFYCREEKQPWAKCPEKQFCETSPQ